MPSGIYVRTKQAKINIGLASKGRPGFWKGKTKAPLSEETKRKIGEKSRGRHHTAETKQKLSLIAKRTNIS